MSAAIVLAAGLLLSASSAPGGETRRVPAGTWGTTGARLDVTDSGAEVEYDCAHGSTARPLVLDSEGRFDVTGAFFREHGGPVGEAQSEGQSVRYTGQLSGEILTLEVLVEGADQPLASHTLTRGKAARIRKCM